MSQVQDLPYWQLTSIFSDLEGADFQNAKTQLKQQLKQLEEIMNKHAIGSGETLELSQEAVLLFESLLNKHNRILQDMLDLHAFLNGFVSTNAFHDQAQAEASELRSLVTKQGALSKRFYAWLGRLELDDLMKRSELANTHAFGLQRAQRQAEHLMSDEAEALASSLDKTGGGAWAKLHTDLVSRISIKASLVGEGKSEFTISELKQLQSNANPAVRQDAYVAELDLLAQHEVSFAAAMNSIKGQMNELALKRGWNNALESALFQNNLTPQSLNAMQDACQESFPVFRRYLKAKASFLGKDKLAWYDLLAPVSAGEAKHYAWEDAKSFVSDRFLNYSPELAAYAEHSFKNNWLDVPSRKGKRNGAFCMGVPGRQESRIMLNYGSTLDDIFTLAHELGHGYHNAQMYKAKRSSLQRSTPMALAETASIFCETIVMNAMLENASDTEKLAILEQDLLGATQLVVDIHSRFIFEQTVFTKRQERELSIDELKGIMLDAQAQTYGDALNESERHPLMWAQKGHYYSTTRSYYNYPYTFGYLFGLGLYAEYQNNPDGFQERYNTLLSSTGMADAKTLANNFGINIEDKSFWKNSLSIAEARVLEYEKLVEAFKA